jgi:sigma-B regulation protein RsbU (phosphoserine phosphatase)
MALGVLPDTTFSQMIFTLKPEDCLVFYTDGVTEAFSSAGEMFGEKRLRETIVHQGRGTMCDLLQNIQKAVRDFTAGAPVSDDLTLLALKHKTVLGQ